MTLNKVLKLILALLRALLNESRPKVALSAIERQTSVARQPVPTLSGVRDQPLLDVTGPVHRISIIR